MRIWLRLFIFLYMLPLLCTNGVADDTMLVKPQSDVAVVTLSRLDKITTQLSTIKIQQGQTVHFGTLEITLETCRKNPPEDTPETVAFLEIIDIGHNGKKKKVFSGWMFASSPALSPLEHPIYDVWVKDCNIVSGPESRESE